MPTGTLERTKAVDGNSSGQNGVSRGTALKVVQVVGWINVGFGMAEIIAPRALSKWTGRSPETSSTRLRGLRKVASGVGILARPRSPRLLWAQAGADVAEMMSHIKAGMSSGREGAGTRAALLAAGMTTLDVVCARQLSSMPVEETGRRFSAAAAINLPTDQCYRVWRDLERLPSYFPELKSVRSVGDHSHWIANGPGGRTIEWDAEVTEDIPNEQIAWRSMESSPIHNSGSVRFERTRGGKGTIVRLHMDAELPVSNDSPVSGLLGRDPAQRLRRSLMRFKQIVETGEIATTEGQPAGNRSGATWMDRIARV